MDRIPEAGPALARSAGGTLAGDPATSGAGPLGRDPPADPRPLRLQVFDHVRAAGHAARADIARRLGISPGSATALTASLIEAGFLRELDGLPREAGRGRPPVALEVVPDAAHVIGLKAGGDRLSAVLADFTGRPLAAAFRPAAARRRTGAALAEEIAALAGDLLDGTGLPLDRIAAIGLGLSGIVDHDSGTVAWSPLLEDRDIPLGALLTARLGRPVRVDNDANMLTFAELWFGAGRETADFAVVTVEQGVGMGLVLGSRLFRGSQGMGMELGHIKVALDGALCRCGRRGCLEAYLADYALVREAATALDRPGPDSPDRLLEMLFARAKAGDPGAAAIFRRAGRYLALGLSNVTQLFDPPLIILSGERMRHDYLYAPEVLAEMERLSLSEGRRPPRVEVHRWDDSVWARGASALALSGITPELLANTG